MANRDREEEDEGHRGEPPQRRFAFAQRWENRRESRRGSRSWAVLGLDLLLVLIIVAISFFLVQFLAE